MFKKILLRFINPVVLFKAWRYHKNNPGHFKHAYDLELLLYSKILKNDMLHYGYFENTEIAPDSISIAALEDAQVRYAQNIIDLVPSSNDLVLDIGCGMGGLTNMLHQKGIKVEALTPNKKQVQHIKTKYPHIYCYRSTLQNFETENRYGTLINSESLQYIPLEVAFEKANKMIKPNGYWIICDYFRIDPEYNGTSHILSNFISKTNDEGWSIVHQQDITPNILPTLKLATLYLDRFLLPLTHYAVEKLHFKKPWLYYILSEQKDAIYKKIDKETATIDPEKFVREKKYMLFLLQKKS